MRYQSPIEYNQARMHAAAVYCSDGRMGEHFDDFLQNGLQLPRYDRVALPGGPACMAGYTQAALEQQSIVDELKFLVDVHGLDRIVLISHSGCAFYSSRLNATDKIMETLQKADLIRAAHYARQITAVANVEAYLARRTDKSVVFEPVSIE